MSIIDDASEPDQRIEDLVGKFPINMRVIRVEPQEKKWIEPLVLVNKTVRECQGEIIMLSFTECLHIGDVISEAVASVKENEYLVFACLGAITEDWSVKIRDAWWNPGRLAAVLPANTFAVERPAEGLMWFVHGNLHRSPYPFCAVLTKNFYQRMGGFDEDFQYGFTCADDDLNERIWDLERKTGTQIIRYMNNPFVIHQAHTQFFWQKPDSKQLHERNFRLLEEKRREQKRMS
jgi:hypothetical protein